MSDLAMTRYLASKPIGSDLWVEPRDLQLSAEQFHSVVKNWISQSGGPGFRYLEGHQESKTGLRLYCKVKVQRTD